MPTFRQFDLLVVNEYVTDTYLFEPHRHTYFEIIYIGYGKGVHLLNNNSIIYKDGDLFLMSPDDQHHFDVHEPTKFVVIKFTDDYFGTLNPSPTGLPIKPQVIMQAQALKEQKLNFDQKAAESLKMAMQSITGYKDSTKLSTSAFVYFQILSIFGLIQQSLMTFSGPHVISGFDKQQLLNYIHQNIYDPQKCRIDVIAPCFNISPTYFGAYFKRNFGVSYRNYFHQYRWSLIEKRLKSGKLNNKQIAVEFCFSDESHFSNYCQKIKKLRALDQ